LLNDTGFLFFVARQKEEDIYCIVACAGLLFLVIAFSGGEE